jgi:hypothetical protein
MQRARTALPDAAAELGARQPDVIADHPQQWRLRVGIDGMPCSIHVQIERHTLPPHYPNRRIVVDAKDSKFRRVAQATVAADVVNEVPKVNGGRRRSTLHRKPSTFHPFLHGAAWRLGYRRAQGGKL